MDASAYIICRDEAGFIGDCLASLKGFSDIVVVDSGSTDGTLEIVADFQRRGLPVRLLHRDWDGYAGQKQFALDQCRGPWCLNLDADERLDERLSAAIRTLPADAPGVAAYRLRRADFLPGYGYAPPSVHARSIERLVHKERARYDPAVPVHEAFLFDGRVARLDEGRILHYRFLSITGETPKIGRYARLKAEALHAAGRRASLASIAFNPLGRFLKSYLVQRFFLCGAPGLIYAGMLAVYVFLTEATLYRLQSGEDVPEE